MTEPMDGLSSSYAEAWHEWEAHSDHLVWDAVVADGLGDTDESS